MRWLRDRGDEVLDIRGTPDEGLDDDQLWNLGLDERRLLITTDKGFAKYRNDDHFGILVIRLRQPNNSKIHERVLAAIGQIDEEEWPGLLMTVRDVAQSSWRANR